MVCFVFFLSRTRVDFLKIFLCDVLKISLSRVQNPKLLEMEQICRRVDLTQQNKHARKEREREDL